jgi:hypothetical protein
MEFHQSQLNAPVSPNRVARATVNNEENAMNHKRFAFALLAVLGMVGAFSSPVRAGGWYFGVNLELTGGQLAQAFSLAPFPSPGVQIGYDFGDGGDGFGVRASLNISLIAQYTLDGYHRFALDANGSNAYVGAGVSYQQSFLMNVQGAAVVHALGGLEWRPTRNFGLFIEATPGVLLQPPALAFTLIVRSGLVLRF